MNYFVYKNKKIRFIQASCVEGKKIDLRQANVVEKYKPNMIFFELPPIRNNPSLIFNNYLVNKKPKQKIDERKTTLKKISKKFPYAISDLRVWENIEKMWGEGNNVFLFNIDAPQKLRFHHFKLYGKLTYNQVKNKWWFWVFLFLREYEMKKNIEVILNKLKKKENPVIAIFLQSIHWNHVKFLLEEKSNEKVWNYYFKRFPEITRENITEKIKEKDKVFFRYWKKINPFGL